MSVPRYERYKDSGIDWLGEVPAHWDVQRFKRIFEERDERSAEGLETLLSVSAYTGVSPRTELLDVGDHLSRAESLEGYKVCYPNDLVMNIMLAWNRGLGVSKYSGIVSPSYCVFRIVDESVPRFLDYLTRSDQSILYVKAFSSGVIESRLRLYPDVFAQLYCALPSLPEQRAIAAFLDRETAAIDALIAAQRRLTALLREKRQATITQAVTTGLDPTVPMTDSGVAWLGLVPAHWNVSSLKRMSLLLTDGSHLSPETEGGVYDFVSTTDIKGDYIDFESCLKTSTASYDYLVRTGCRPDQGDVLFSKDGTIGRTVVVKEPRAFVVASSLIIIRPDRRLLDATYLHYLCQSTVMSQQVGSMVKGAGLPRLSIQNLLKVSGAFPPIGEQEAIVSFLNHETARIDALIVDAETAIALLHERRGALISAAVTGAIDVRGLVAPEAAG